MIARGTFASRSAAFSRRGLGAALLILGALVAGGCTSTVAQISPLGKTHPAKAADAPIAVHERELPSRRFERIARLDVHVEKTGFMASDLREALPKLKELARRAGADAIIEVREQRSSVAVETKIYHVTATAIRYLE